MLSSVLRSKPAIQVYIEIMRPLVRLRRILAFIEAEGKGETVCPTDYEKDKKESVRISFKSM